MTKQTDALTPRQRKILVDMLANDSKGIASNRAWYGHKPVVLMSLDAAFKLRMRGLINKTTGGYFYRAKIEVYELTEIGAEMAQKLADVHNSSRLEGSEKHE